MKDGTSRRAVQVFSKSAILLLFTMLLAPAGKSAELKSRFARFDNIKVPLLAVLAKSPLWRADTEQFLGSLAPNLEFYMWIDVSHFLMMEKPDEFNRTLQAFLVKNKLLKN